MRVVDVARAVAFTSSRSLYSPARVAAGWGRGGATADEVEGLISGLHPRQLAKAAKARIDRQMQRARDRASAAQALLAARAVELRKGADFSMERAALVRIAAGAEPVEVVDGRSRAARAAKAARLRGNNER